jgi:sec-independent protein translocase protein TatA
MRLGFGEIAIILIIALLIFGPKKLPQLGEALGKGIRNFKKSAEGNDDEAPPAKETPASELPSRAQGAPAPASPQTVTTDRKQS